MYQATLALINECTSIYRATNNVSTYASVGCALTTITSRSSSKF